MAKTKEPAPLIEVVATQRGYYRDALRQPGEKFLIDKVEDFSWKWMESSDERILDLEDGPRDV